jgi:membrane-bound lytic murein transglycosylase B
MEISKLMNIALRIAFVLGLTSLALSGSAHADYAERADVREYVDELVSEHGFDRADLLELFSEAERKERILESIARPAERTLEWHEYRQIFVKEPRISQGVEFWAANEEILNAAEARYGVAPEYVVAIIGVETRYGRITGSYRVLDALMTLAFDYPPRSSFFRKELTEYLLLAREEGEDPATFTGSYAGAMGYGQFIPSSYRAYAVDFDEDGARDIWANEADAIGSVANYFSRHGWQAGEPVAMQVTLGGEAADGLATKSLALQSTVGALTAAGVQLAAADLDGTTPANLYRMMQPETAEYWVGFKNFYVITRYNHSRLYALAVHELSQAVLAARQEAGVRQAGAAE